MPTFGTETKSASYPYYQILWHEVGCPVNEMHIGYGSYNLDLVTQWQHEYFNFVDGEEWEDNE